MFGKNLLIVGFAVAFSSATAFAGGSIAAGRIKSVSAESKEFVVTDADGKDWSFKFADKFAVNRDGKETGSDLKAGDAVNVCYSSGALSRSAHYILVQEGENKNVRLAHGAIKSYDSANQRVVFTDENGKDWSLSSADSRIRIAEREVKMADIQIGDKALLILETSGDKTTLRTLIAQERK